MSQWRKEPLETIPEKDHESKAPVGQQEANNAPNGFAQGNRIKLLFLFIAWTAFTSISVHSAKLYLSNNGSVAILTATTHLIGALPCIAPVISCEEWTLSRRFLRDVGFAAVFNLCNTLLTNYSLLQSSVQIVYAIKGLEPTFTTILSCLVANQYPSAAEIIAMSGLAITMGLTIRSDPDVPTMIYVASILAVAVVSMRSVLLKHAMSQHRQSVLQIFTAVNAISGVLSLFFIKAEDVYDLTVTASTRTYVLLLASSVASLAYYLVSLIFLSYVRADTHSLFNVFKRLLVALPSSHMTSHLLPTSMHAICILSLNAGTLFWAMLSSKNVRTSGKKATRIPVFTTACLGIAVLIATSIIVRTGVEHVAQSPSQMLYSDTPWLKSQTQEVVQARQEIDTDLRAADITVLRTHRMADTGNIGDLYSSPFHYFAQLNNTGQLALKDIDHPALRKQSQRSDVIVLGGGGLLQVVPEWDKTMNDVLMDAQSASGRKPRPVIGWGLGFNGGRDLAESHARGAFYPSTPYLSKFTLLGIRDKVPGYRWVPCVSNMFEGFDYLYPSKRAIGWFQHSGSTYSLDEHAGLGPDDVRSNAAMDFNETVAFLGSSEVVLTTSYHGLYWATLLGRKVVVLEAKSRKFDLFPWPPVFFSGDLNRDIARAKSYPHALEESRQATLEFWSDVKKLLYEASGIEKHD